MASFNEKWRKFVNRFMAMIMPLILPAVLYYGFFINPILRPDRKRFEMFSTLEQAFHASSEKDANDYGMTHFHWAGLPVEWLTCKRKDEKPTTASREEVARDYPMHFRRLPDEHLVIFRYYPVGGEYFCDFRVDRHQTTQTETQIETNLKETIKRFEETWNKLRSKQTAR